jgi:Na+/phosphate symporter
VSRYGPLAAAAVLLIGAALDLNFNEETNLGEVLITAGLIILGAWLTIEIYHLWHDHEHHKKDGEEEDG